MFWNSCYSACEEWGLKINREKTEYLVLNFQIIIDNSISIKQIDQTIYLGTITDRRRTSERKIRSRMKKSRKVLRCFNSIWWDKNIIKNTRMRIERTLVESVLNMAVSYGL